ncbi:MAG TPA: subclass B3 metallo-beta-lactamase [Candidatus Baltobacteraceae bacterium]|nr:subclass B3 metallo-beta-lactamase [Candidatus Baltobacteraceae bacterium]
MVSNRGFPSRCPWLLALAILLAVPAAAQAQANEQSRAMNQPVPPFHIIGNIYYVGASDIASYLIVTRHGDILLDGGFVETAPQIEANIRTLGFKLSDVKILLNSHEHLDHAGGLAELKRLTHARLVAMAQEVRTLESGKSFPAVTPDRIIHHGSTVTLGGVTLTAHLTPGHTPGCTTWTMLTKDNGKPYHVVFVGSASVLPNYKLIDRPGSPATYPGIEADYEKTFRVLKSLPCDVFLGAHGSFYSLVQKREAMSKHPAQNPFIDPAGYQAYVAHAEAAFQAELRRERQG